METDFVGIDKAIYMAGCLNGMLENTMENDLVWIDKAIHLAGCLNGMLAFIFGVLTIFFQFRKFEKLEPVRLYFYAPLCMAGSFSAIYIIYCCVTLFGNYDFLEMPMAAASVAIWLWILFSCLSLVGFFPLYAQSRTYCYFLRALVTPTLLNRNRNEREASATKPKIPDKLPNHKGDRNCVVCQARNSVPASIYSCGHYFACRSCFPHYMAENYVTCQRCKAGRVY